MFLSELNELEKNYFLDLCILVAKANNELALEEKNLIQAYCGEMQIPPRAVFSSNLEPLELTLPQQVSILKKSFY